MFCPHCGKSIADIAKFCPYCGANLKGLTSSSKESVPNDPESSCPQTTSNIDTHKLTIYCQEQSFLANSPMRVLVDEQFEYSIESGKSIELDLPEGKHSVRVSASIRKKRIPIALNSDIKLVLSWNRFTGAIQAEIYGVAPSSDGKPSTFISSKQPFTQATSSCISTLNNDTPPSTSLESQNQPEDRGFPLVVHKRGLLIGPLALIGAIMISVLLRLSISFPGANIGDVLAELTTAQVTAPISQGDTFGQDDLAITPIEVTYTSSSVFYDEYSEPYVSVSLDISCLSGTWAPKYEDVVFWIDGSSAFSQPDFSDVEIERGEDYRYTFTQPLITTSAQDAEMMLKFECLTGAVVELYFTIEDIQNFFSSNENLAGEEYSYDESNDNNFSDNWGTYNPVDRWDYVDHDYYNEANGEYFSIEWVESCYYNIYTDYFYAESVWIDYYQAEVTLIFESNDEMTMTLSFGETDGGKYFEVYTEIPDLLFLNGWYSTTYGGLYNYSNSGTSQHISILGKYEHENNGCVITVNEFTGDGGGYTLEFFLSEENYQEYEYLNADLMGTFYYMDDTAEYSFEIEGDWAYLYFYMVGDDTAEIEVLNNSWESIGENEIPVSLIEGIWYRTEEYQSLQ